MLLYTFVLYVCLGSNCILHQSIFGEKKTVVVLCALWLYKYYTHTHVTILNS